jgi:hypothetical protein
MCTNDQLSYVIFLIVQYLCPLRAFVKERTTSKKRSKEQTR